MACPYHSVDTQKKNSVMKKIILQFPKLKPNPTVSLNCQHIFTYLNIIMSLEG